MKSTQILAGWKTYGVAALALAYAAYGYFYAHTLTQDAAVAIVFGAGGLGAMRSGLTTEVQKMLAAFGVNPAVNASTVAGLEDRALSNIKAFIASSTAGAGKVAGLVLVLLLAAPMLQGCQTYEALFGGGSTTTLCSTPSQCVYQAKGVFAAGLALATTYGSLPACPQGAPICKDETLVASIRTQAHNVQTDLNAADLLVNSGLLPSGAPATPADMKAAADNASKEATAFQTTATGLPHS